MLAATFALLGVVVGGVLNGLVAWRLEEMRNRRAARVSARLIGDHLARIGNSLELATSEAAAARGRPENLPLIDREDAEMLLADWAQHRERLATTFSTDDWQAVADSIVLVRTVVELPNDAKVRRLVRAAAITHVHDIQKALGALRAAE